MDYAIANRREHWIPWLFNWTTSFKRLYFDKLLRGMFRRYGNQYKFQDFSFTVEDLAAFEVEQLEDSLLPIMFPMPVLSAMMTLLPEISKSLLGSSSWCAMTSKFYRSRLKCKLGN